MTAVDELGVALVTGAASGIGKACVLQLLSEGYAVAAFDRDQDGLDRLDSECDAVTIRVDARDSEAIQSACADIDRRFGRVDALVAAAGVSVQGKVGEMDSHEWTEAVSGSLTSTWSTCRAALPLLQRQSSSCLVTFGSILGRHAMGGYGAYGAAKAGVEALTRSVAVEYGDSGVRAVCVVAGAIDTPMMWQEVSKDEISQIRNEAEKEIPLGRLGLPEEIARLVAFVVSPACLFLNGTSIVVDGGVLARSPSRF